jgi:hypothetical protein
MVRMMHVLERIARAFGDANTPLLVLKGGALNLVLYERPDVRPMDDIDLLVRPEHAEQACVLLERIGAVPGGPFVREDFFPRFVHEREYTIGHVYPVKIDLHVRPFRPLRYSRLIPDDAFWARAEEVRIGAARILVPCAEDMLIHLTVHSAIHKNSRPTWRRDIKDWVDARRMNMDWDCFVRTVRQWGLALPVRRAIEGAERDFGPVCPSAVIHSLSRSRVTWRDRLALWHAPRDASHPVAHVAVNAVCTPGWRYRLGYLRAMLCPSRAFMADWCGGGHRVWLPVAHAMRWLRPIALRVPWLCRWSQKARSPQGHTPDGRALAAAVTRRAFMHGLARKARYVTPVVLGLVASEARAGSHGDYDSTCGEVGSPCQAGPDCCAGLNCVGPGPKICQ